jgi:hypothetical protein
MPKFRLPDTIASMEPTAIQNQAEDTVPENSPPLVRARIVSTPGTCGGKPRDGLRM